MKSQIESEQRVFRPDQAGALHSFSPQGGERLKLTPEGAAIVSLRSRRPAEARDPSHPVQTLTSVTPDDRMPDVQLSLRAQAWGREGETAELQAHTAHAENQRAERNLDSAHGGLTEWWQSGERGFQVGWTVAQAPAGHGQLALDLDLDCPWPVSVSGDARRLDFADPAGSGWQLTCADLMAFDAQGRDLPAQMQMAQGRLQIRVDDTGAEYPVVIDPWIFASLRTTYRAPFPFTGMQFGARIAAHGDVVAAVADAAGASDFFDGELHIYSGAGNDYRRTIPRVLRPLPSIISQTQFSISGDYLAAIAANAAGDQLIALICERNAGGPEAWSTVAEIPLPDGYEFGQAELSGEFLAVSRAAAAPGGFVNAGAVSIHRRDAGGANGWGQVALLDAAEFRQAGGYFGFDVSFSGRTLAIAAVSGSGISYFIHERESEDGALWTRTRMLTLPGAQGLPVSQLVGDTFAFSRLNGPSAEPVRIYERNAGGPENWGLVRSIAGPAGEPAFGFSLALLGSTLAVSNPLEDVDHDGNSATPKITDAGTVRVYSRDQGGVNNWGLIRTFAGEGSEVEAGGRAGAGIAFGREGFLLMGYPKEDVTLPNIPDAGSVGAWQLQSGEWTRTPLAAHSQNATDWGAAVAVSGDMVLVGAPRFDGPAGVDAGWAFLFRNGVLEKSLLPPGQEAGERFGAAVALDGDRAVVASPLRSGTLGAISYADLGAVTIFERNQGGAGNWGVVKSFAQPSVSNTSASPKFGTSVALSGDVLAVGSPEETALSLPGTAVKGRARIFYRNTGGAENWGFVRTVSGADNGTDEFFGSSVALSGDTLLAGAPGEDANGILRSGAVYVLRRNTGGMDNWGRAARLIQPEVKGDSFFGQSVALDGDDAVIGAPREDRNISPNVGAVYFFARARTEADAWSFTRRWQSDAWPDEAATGTSVAVSHGLALAGAPFTTATQGTVLVFAKNSGGADAWAVVRQLGGGESYGRSVALDGRCGAIGEPLAEVTVSNVQQTDRGNAHQFVLEGGEFVPAALRIAPAGSGGFGQGVALHREWLVVGAPNETVGADIDAGAAYVFHRDRPAPLAYGLVQRLTDVQDNSAGTRFGASVTVDGHWLAVGVPGAHRVQLYYLRNDPVIPAQFVWVDSLSLSAGGQANAFGTSVALEGDFLLAGAPLQDVSGQTDAGAAYLFARNQGGADAWVLADPLTATDPGAGDAFGTSVSLSRGLAAVGAPLDNNAEGTDAGAVYLFARNQGGADAWGQTLKLVPSSLAAGDEFGRSVALRDGLLLAGAPRSDLVAADAGLALLFERNHTGADAWGALRAFTAPDTTAQSRFGTSVALSSSHAIVGAPFADPRGLSNAGTVHVFGRDWLSDESWAHMQSLAPTQSSAGALFGSAVACDGVFMAMTAPGEIPGRVHLYDFAARRHYHEWANAHGLEGAWIDPAADADGDGQPNLVEMILGSHPRDGSIRGRVGLARQPGQIVITAWKNSFPAATVLLSAEVSANLAVWTELPPQDLLSDTGSELKFQLPVVSGTARFARLRARLP